MISTGKPFKTAFEYRKARKENSMALLIFRLPIKVIK